MVEESVEVVLGEEEEGEEYLDLQEYTQDTQDAPELATEPAQSSSHDVHVPKRKRKAAEQAALNGQLGSIMSKVENQLDNIGNRHSNRHASFGSLLADRMNLLPLEIARGLEVEFLAKVNTLLDELS